MTNRPRPRWVYRRFSDCSVSEKFVDSLFLVMIGIGYLLAMTYLYTSHEWLDAKPGLSINDVAYTYYGNRSGTRLESAMRGPMSVYIDIESRDEVIHWIYKGAPQADFQKQIKPIFEKNCIACHGEQSGMKLVGLFDEKDIKALTEVDTGKSLSELARVSHIHLFGIGMVLYLLGRIFILCEMPIILKRIIVVIPFAAIAVDIGSWWITHWVPLFAYMVVIGGALTGLSIAVQILMSLYQMWFYKFKEPEDLIR